MKANNQIKTMGTMDHYLQNTLLLFFLINNEKYKKKGLYPVYAVRKPANTGWMINGKIPTIRPIRHGDLDPGMSCLRPSLFPGWI